MKAEEFAAKVREAILAQRDKIRLVEGCWGEPALDGSADIECGCPITFLIRYLFGAEKACASVQDDLSAYSNSDLANLFSKEGIEVTENQLHSFYRGFDNRFDDDGLDDWWRAGNEIRRQFLYSEFQYKEV